MGNYRISQLDDLPSISGVQFGRTIGQGSFAMVKIARLKNDETRIFAIKFINRAICHRQGMSDDAIGKEVLIHQHCSKHPNVIKIFQYSSDHPKWLFAIMELATGGDLFDKIEPDIGVDEEVSQFYFRQMVNAIEYLHTKGVAHRDIKPENILLHADGNLKIADFGMATVFRKNNGDTRLCYSACGSPPYMAPELAYADAQGYDAAMSDIWSTGVVLFVLLTGETPWEEPTEKDASFKDFIRNDGKIISSSWNKIDILPLSLLRGILRADVTKRYNFKQIKSHIWFNRKNKFANDNDLCIDGAALMTRLLSKLHIPLDDEQLSAIEEDKYDSIERPHDNFISTQPMVDISSLVNDEEEEDNVNIVPATQQVYTERERRAMSRGAAGEKQSIFNIISKDPAAFQFSKQSGLTASASRFNLLTEAERLTRFFSVMNTPELLQVLGLALSKVGIPETSLDFHHYKNDSILASHPLLISINIHDRRKMILKGTLKVTMATNSLKRLDFVKSRGDPLEWRRLFKRIVLLCRECVYLGE